MKKSRAREKLSHNFHLKNVRFDEMNDTQLYNSMGKFFRKIKKHIMFTTFNTLTNIKYMLKIQFSLYLECTAKKK